MKKNYIVKQTGYIRQSLWVFAVLMIGIFISSCTGKKEDKHGDHDDPGAVNIDSNLAHLLKPSNEQVVSTLPLIKAEYGTKIFTEEAQGVIGYDTRNESSIASRVAGRIERLMIKYNYQPIRKGQLIMEIYSPDLAAAQQELLFLKAGNDPALLGAAKQRLMLLGMSANAVNNVLKTGKVNYRIPVYSNADGYILEKSAASTVVSAPEGASASAGGDGMSGMGASSSPAPAANTGAAVSTPVLLREGQYVTAGSSLFTIYNEDRLIAEFSLKPALAALLKKTDQFLFYKTADKNTMTRAQIGMIQPVFKDGENFTIARIYLNKPSFRVGELLTAKIPVLISDSWWLPESALVSLGNEFVLFKKEGNVVVPKAVKTGVTISGMVQIKDDISNWEVSGKASYLVDSESFIREPLKK